MKKFILTFIVISANNYSFADTCYPSSNQSCPAGTICDTNNGHCKNNPNKSCSYTSDTCTDDDGTCEAKCVAQPATALKPSAKAVK
jgi:hypothetical protein